MKKFLLILFLTSPTIAENSLNLKVSFLSSYALRGTSLTDGSVLKVSPSYNWNTWSLGVSSFCYLTEETNQQFQLFENDFWIEKSLHSTKNMNLSGGFYLLNFPHTQNTPGVYINLYYKLD